MELTGNDRSAILYLKGEKGGGVVKTDMECGFQYV